MKNKDKKFYKIDPSTKLIIEVYNKAKDIPAFNGGFYQHIKGLGGDLFTDGYIYRREQDVVLNEDGTEMVEDKLKNNSKENRRLKKYDKVIEYLKMYGDESYFSVYKRLKVAGIDVSHETVRKLKKELGL